MAYLQSEGRLPRAEHNLLGEAFLIMASSAGFVLLAVCFGVINYQCLRNY